MSILEEGLEAQAEAMREFGYHDVTDHVIRKAHEAWRDGQAPVGVIQMFSFKAFEEHPQIFGEPPEPSK